MARSLVAILTCVPLALFAAGGTLERPTSLQGDAQEMARSGRPMVVLYSQQGCHWCEQARAYLVPLSNAPQTRDLALFRQIDLDSDAPLTDFAGKPTTQRAFARGDRVRVTPTVVIYGADGRRLGSPIVGMRLPDFYGQYVEEAIDAARRSLKGDTQG